MNKFNWDWCFLRRYSHHSIFQHVPEHSPAMCFPCSRRCPHFWVDQTPINCLKSPFSVVTKIIFFPKITPFFHGSMVNPRPKTPSRGGHTLSLSFCSAHLSSVAGMVGIRLGSGWDRNAMDFQELNGSWKIPNRNAMDLGDYHHLQCWKNGGIFKFNMFGRADV